MGRSVKAAKVASVRLQAVSAIICSRRTSSNSLMSAIPTRLRAANRSAIELDLLVERCAMPILLLAEINSVTHRVYIIAHRWHIIAVSTHPLCDRFVTAQVLLCCVCEHQYLIISASVL